MVAVVAKANKIYKRVLVGLGLTGRAIYSRLKPDLVIDPNPFVGFTRKTISNDRPFEPIKITRSQAFGGWGYVLNENTLNKNILVRREALNKIKIAKDILTLYTNKSSYKTQKLCLALPPQELVPLLRGLGYQQKLVADEHAVGTYLLVHPSPIKNQIKCFIGPNKLETNHAMGFELIGPYAFKNLHKSWQRFFKSQKINFESYHVAHVFLAGAFTCFEKNKKTWIPPTAKLIHRCEAEFKKLIEKTCLHQAQAVCIREFSEDVGCFHQSALRGKEKIWDKKGFLLDYPQIQVLGSAILPKLKGKHPTFDIVNTSKKNCQDYVD